MATQDAWTALADFLFTFESEQDWMERRAIPINAQIILMLLYYFRYKTFVFIVLFSDDSDTKYNPVATASPLLFFVSQMS